VKAERLRVLKRSQKSKGDNAMLPKINLALAFVLLTLAFGSQPSASAQDSAKHDNQVKTLETGRFHGNVHQTSGRATIYQEETGKLVLRLTSFKTSNGPDVHVILIAAKDADDDANFLKSDTERVELGKLKGNEGDQNYEFRPARTLPNSEQYRSIANASTQILAPRLSISSEAESSLHAHRAA
jgi:hypothetical protein